MFLWHHLFLFIFLFDLLRGKLTATFERTERERNFEMDSHNVCLLGLGMFFFLFAPRLVQGSHAATVISLEAGAGTLYGNVSSFSQQFHRLRAV